MAACVKCDRTLEPAWKYCIFCGTRTTVTDSAPRSRPLPTPARIPVPSLTVNSARTAAATAVAEAPAPTPPAPTPPTPPLPIAPPAPAEPVRISTLAILAMVLGVLASPLAAVFGHLALSRLRTSGERGVIVAWIAAVLGYIWLGFFLVLGIMYLATNG